MATQPQVNQLIARIATGLKPENTVKDRLQALLDDPDGMDRLVDEFINEYERRTYPTILFLSQILGGVLFNSQSFCDLSTPPTKHFSDSIKLV